MSINVTLNVACVDSAAFADELGIALRALRRGAGPARERKRARRPLLLSWREEPGQSVAPSPWEPDATCVVMHPTSYRSCFIARVVFRGYLVFLSEHGSLRASKRACERALWRAGELRNEVAPPVATARAQECPQNAPEIPPEVAPTDPPVEQ